MRVLSGNIFEWQRHRTNPAEHKFCTGSVISHFDSGGEKIAVARNLVLKRETDEFWKENLYGQRIKYLEKNEVAETLSDEEVRVIEGL